ncbi:MAG: hypothetical protein AAF939_07080 [Planctomycetota bacterium]
MKKSLSERQSKNSSKTVSQKKPDQPNSKHPVNPLPANSVDLPEANLGHYVEPIQAIPADLIGVQLPGLQDGVLDEIANPIDVGQDPFHDLSTLPAHDVLLPTPVPQKPQRQIRKRVGDVKIGFNVFCLYIFWISGIVCPLFAMGGFDEYQTVSVIAENPAFAGKTLFQIFTSSLLINGCCFLAMSFAVIAFEGLLVTELIRKLSMPWIGKVVAVIASVTLISSIGLLAASLMAFQSFDEVTISPDLTQRMIIKFLIQLVVSVAGIVLGIFHSRK